MLQRKDGASTARRSTGEDAGPLEPEKGFRHQGRSAQAGPSRPWVTDPSRDSGLNHGAVSESAAFIRNAFDFIAPRPRVPNGYLNQCGDRRPRFLTTTRGDGVLAMRRALLSILVCSLALFLDVDVAIAKKGVGVAVQAVRVNQSGRSPNRSTVKGASTSLPGNYSISEADRPRRLRPHCPRFLLIPSPLQREESIHGSATRSASWSTGYRRPNIFAIIQRETATQIC